MCADAGEPICAALFTLIFEKLEAHWPRWLKACATEEPAKPRYGMGRLFLEGWRGGVQKEFKRSSKNQRNERV